MWLIELPLCVGLMHAKIHLSSFLYMYSTLIDLPMDLYLIFCQFDDWQLRLSIGGCCISMCGDSRYITLPSDGDQRCKRSHNSSTTDYCRTPYSTCFPCYVSSGCCRIPLMIYLLAARRPIFFSVAVLSPSNFSQHLHHQPFGNRINYTRHNTYTVVCY